MASWTPHQDTPGYWCLTLTLSPDHAVFRASEHPQAEHFTGQIGGIGKEHVGSLEKPVSAPQVLFTLLPAGSACPWAWLW